MRVYTTQERILKNCQQCGTVLYVKQSDDRRGGGKYCSHTCFYAHNRGKNNNKWKGGVKIHAHGYRLITSPNHPFKDKQGYVREHRLVMEMYIGRYLEPYEDVHHLDNDKQNNDIGNLELFASRSEHLKKYHQRGGEKSWFKKGEVAFNKYLTERKCLECGTVYAPRDTKRKYCTQQCYWNSKILKKMEKTNA